MLVAPCVLQASVNGHSAVVELLLGAGAQHQTKNKEGRTAADMAKTPEITQRLQAQSASGS